jgi:hypothetical protein
MVSWWDNLLICTRNLMMCYVYFHFVLRMFLYLCMCLRMCLHTHKKEGPIKSLIPDKAICNFHVCQAMAQVQDVNAKRRIRRLMHLGRKGILLAHSYFIASILLVYY